MRLLVFLIATGAFALAQAVSLEGLQDLSEVQRDALLRPADVILERFARVALDSAEGARFCQGQSLAKPGLGPGLFRVYGAEERFLGLGEVVEEGRLAPKRLLGETGGAPPDLRPRG